MTTEEIRSAVKRSIARITSIDPQDISDQASYKDDLKLDSLTILEIAVDAEYQFKIKIPDEAIPRFLTVGDIVIGVNEHLAAQ